MHILLKSLLAEAIQSAYGYWIYRHGNLTVVQNWGDHSKEAESIIYKLGAKSLPAKLVIDKESFDI